MSEETKLSRRQFIKDAAVGAAAVAGAGMLGPVPAVAAPVPPKWDKETDVVVIGGGLAGLSASIEAAAAGAKVVLLEKMADLTSSHSSWSVGNVAGAGSKLQAKLGFTDSPDEWIKDMVMGGTRLMPKEFLNLFAESGGKHIDWLMDQGVQFMYVCLRGGDNIPRAHMAQGDARALVTPLADRAKEKGVEILLNTRALQLVRLEDNTIVGVKAKTQTGELAIKAKRATILACGDYSNGKEIKAKFTDDKVDINAGVGGDPGNTGDGFLMGWSVGADFTNLDDIGKPSGLYMNPLMPRGTGIEGSIIKAGAIIVNKDGKRYVNEVASIGDKETLKQPDGVGFVVFDSKAATTDIVPKGAFTGKGPWICTARFLEDWKKIPDAVKQADTIEDLAKKLGVSATGLKDTIDKINAYVAAGKDADFGRGGLVAIKQPPFYGLGPGKPLTILSGGTLMVNLKHQVLDVYGQVIPKLYAAGDMGKSGAVAGHGTHNAWAVISGRRSGQNAAGEKPWGAV